jgi:serine/threonine-protein kinase HipA
MAWGDAFSLDEVGAFQLADFAQRCGIDRNLLKREAARLAKLAVEQAPKQALADDYIDDGERGFAGRLGEFVVGQAERLNGLAVEAAKIKAEFPRTPKLVHTATCRHAPLCGPKSCNTRNSI